MSRRTTVRLPEDLLARARRHAAAQGRTLTALLEEGLRSIVAGKPPGERSRRRLPRVSKAGGGLAAGVDLSDFSRLIEDEDRLTVERMRRFK